MCIVVGGRATDSRHVNGLRIVGTKSEVAAHVEAKVGAPRDQIQHPRARNDYDEEAAYESYMNPEPGSQSGPGDSANAD